MRGVRRREPDPTERLRRLLALPADETATEPLLEAVSDVSLDVARQALRRLVPLAGPAEIARLRQRILDLDVGIVADVAAALRELRDERATAAVVSHLGSGSWSERHKAVLALRELQDVAARRPLVRALADPAPPVRRVALEALLRLPGDAETVGVCARRLSDSDPLVRAAAVAAIAALDPDAAATLEPTVRDPHPSVRAALAAEARVLASDSVGALLRDDDGAVRVAALEALTRDPRREQTPLLLEALDAPSWHVRRAAVDVLGASGGDDAVAPRLVRALVDPHPLVRGRGLLALERLLGDRLDELLAASLTHGEPRLRRALVELLGRRRCIAPLLELAHDQDTGVRIALVHALEHAPEVEAKHAVERLASDPDVAVRHAATMALGGEAAPTRSP